MNYTNTTIHSDLNIHDTRVVENAVKNAIRVVVDIIYNVSNSKMREYKMMLDERDKEISRLEVMLKQTEDELIQLQSERNHVNPFTANYSISMTNEHEVELDFPCVAAKMSPSVYSLSQEGMAAEPSNQEDPEHQMSHSSQTGLRIASYCPSLGRLATSPVIKEESPAVETAHIKTEICEQGCDEHRDRPLTPNSKSVAAEMSPWAFSLSQEGMPVEPSNQADPEQPMSRSSQPGSTHCPSLDRPMTPNSRRKLRNAENQRQYRERCRSTPEGVQMLKEKDRISYYKKRVLVSQMSEEAKRKKRDKWRAAQRRRRDRKRFEEGLSQATFVQADDAHPHHLSDNTDKPESIPRRRGRPRKGGQVPLEFSGEPFKPVIPS